MAADNAAANFDGITATTVTDPPRHYWQSVVTLPLSLFNVGGSGSVPPAGSQWRMNFFRSITNATLFPDQLLGGWNVPNVINFHVTPCFGQVTFV